MMNRKELEQEYKKIDSEINRIEETIEPLRNKQAKIWEELAELAYGLKVGEDLIYDGIKGKVEKFNSFWVIIRPYKKDGTLSFYLKNCFNIKRKFFLP